MPKCKSEGAEDVIAGGQRYLVPQLVSYKPDNGSESIPQNR